MSGVHSYTVNVLWTGAGTSGTESYTSYARDHEVVVAGKPAIEGSSDPAFRGDESRYAPEELFVASLSQCHMLWALQMAARAGVRVVGYSDRAIGAMRIQSVGGGQFIGVTLHPQLTVADEVDEEAVARIHADAHAYCFISRSVNFPVRISPVTTIVAAPEHP
ncbi:OsmC family peroxiredoxin [Pseudactinotalea sp. HY160]|uniref:OsmC family protein n=1 Tax=Pseudactinotalea sp. HY160 TaxID=2654490 RepID=UPI00128DE6F8|nr:OsmC family protein [Pseudactinotalea sp. HY160]MPV49967.1 OsmC family peroxiredoxin [Pseudactinotalea sp. HY160]